MCTSDRVTTIAMFALIAEVWSALFLLQGCAYQTSQWNETPDGRFEYRQTNLTPPFGKQSESAGQMSAEVNADGTWDLRIGRTDTGVDNTAQQDLARQTLDILSLIGKLYATGGM